MPNLIETITLHPTVNAFRCLHRDGDDPRLWEYAAEFGDAVTEAEEDGFYILGAMNIRSTTDVRCCYLDVSMPERINDYAYVFDGGELRYDYPHKLVGEFIPAIAIDGFGLYELFYS